MRQPERRSPKQEGKSPANQPLALRAAVAARLLGVSQRTLHAWTLKRLVPHIRIGGVILYPYYPLRRWLADLAKQSASSQEVQESQRSVADGVGSQ